MKSIVSSRKRGRGVVVDKIKTYLNANHLNTAIEKHPPSLIPR